MNSNTTACSTRLVLLALALASWESRALAAGNEKAEAIFQRVAQTVAAGPYHPTWDSLKTHQDPEWFRDAKFGIYNHWGPITVATDPAPAEMEWYGQQLYLTNHPAFKYHQQRFGDQKTTGYKDVIPFFKAENFNADAWASLFARAGAKFAGPVAIHHDNFANWDSRVSRWNSQAMGPKRDLTGELERAIRQQGLKFITTFHHGFAWRYFQPAFAYDAADPQFGDLYSEPHQPQDPPSPRYLDLWLAKVDEVLENYRPDLIWFDFELGSVISPDYQRRMFATAYNWAERNQRTIGIAHKHREIHQYTGILDFERGREDRLTPYPWLTDTSVGPWFHHQILGFKKAGELIQVLVDIVSKNGCMLLNVGPAADGSIPPQGQALLLGLGDWLRTNGEAIYNTRPWAIYGEGPTRLEGGAFSEERARQGYTARDLRFTQSKDHQALYILALGWPDREFTVRSIQVDAAAADARVDLLGGGALDFQINDRKQLVVRMPATQADGPAFAFKLTGFKTSVHPLARFDQPEAIQLTPDRATLEGRQIKTQVNEGRPNIGFWDRPTERAHWLVWIPEPGRYLVRGEFSSANGGSGLKISVAGRELSSVIPRTAGWFKPEFTSFGDCDFARPGVYQLVLEPANPGQWRPVNVYQLQLAR